MEPLIKTFFTTPYFAVAGASTAPHKFGHKLLSWYLSHSLPVTPINPTTARILNTPCIASVRDLPHPRDTALSIVTPPAVTAKVLEEAAAAGVRRVWLQPGSWEGGEEAVEGFRKVWGERGVEVVVMGGSGSGRGEGELGGEGACVLVHGEMGMRAAGRVGRL
ncbi:CoA binding domain-containing protein [Geopyxis carbonaria]|nr:CoA binding domain-containing protein [Geopyxis carbonaria]